MQIIHSPFNRWLSGYVLFYVNSLKVVAYHIELRSDSSGNTLKGYFRTNDATWDNLSSSTKIIWTMAKNVGCLFQKLKYLNE